MARNLEFYDREDRPWPNNRLKSAAIIGHTTDHTARIWVRVRKCGSYMLVVSESEIPSGRISDTTLPGDDQITLEIIDENAANTVAGRFQKHSFTFDTDLTHVFDFSCLPSGTELFYAVIAEDPAIVEKQWQVGRDASHSFRTRDTASTDVTFGLFSCHMPYDGHNLVNMEMWDSFQEILEIAKADFVIGCGDQVYADGTSSINIWKWLRKVKDDLPKNKKERIKIMKSWYRDIYRGYWGPLSLRKVFRRYPTYMVWDDHEIMDGWGSYTTDELSDRLDSLWEWENQKKNLGLAKDMFEAAKAVYGEYEHSHNPKTKPGQFDYSYEWGDCAFYVMDMRGHRDFTRAQNKILGKAQLERVLAWLASPKVQKAKAVFIVSPVPVVHVSEFIVNHLDINLIGAADDLRDEWEHESNWTERDKILDAVFDFSAKQKKTVVFLSGDVHIGAGFKLSRKSQPDARIYQLTSSAITYHLSHWKRSALELIVRNNGTLGAEKSVRENNPTTFRLFHTFKRNNFGIVRTTRGSGGALELSWELYGSTGEEDEIVKLKRIKL